jgi:ABC-type dipeptide/oligopeptide/nickel transport system permease subunit
MTADSGSLSPNRAEAAREGAAGSAQDFRLHKPRSLWADAARRFSRNKLSMVALVFVVALILMAVFAGVLAPEGYDHQVLSDAWQFPSARHPLGTDPFGRDVLTRIMYGGRISLAVGFISTFFALLIGLPVGMAAAWFGGPVDYFFCRVMEILNAIPNLLLGIMIMAILGAGIQNVLFVFIFTGWMGTARMIRGQFLTLREHTYVEAARAIGVRDWKMIWRHLLPNAYTVLIVGVSIAIPAAILGEASLSFLGIGINPPLPSWGRMLNDYLPAVQTHWYLALFPALMIAITMFAFTLMGDGLQDALDPTAGK